MILDELKAARQLKGLTESEYRELAEMGQEKTFAPGTVFIEQGSTDRTVYLIVGGTVQIYRALPEGNRIPFGIVGAGETIGEMSIVDGKPRSAMVEAIQETKVIAFDYDQFVSFIHRHPELFVNILKLVVARLRDAHQKMEEITSLSLVERTWNTLQILSPHFPGGNIPLSHEDLADIIGATRARVSESLQDLNRHNKIELAYRKIKIV